MPETTDRTASDIDRYAANLRDELDGDVDEPVLLNRPNWFCLVVGRACADPGARQLSEPCDGLVDQSLAIAQIAAKTEQGVNHGVAVPPWPTNP